MATKSLARQQMLGRTFIYGSLALLAALYLMPLWVMITTSLKPLDEIYSGSFIGLPETVTFRAASCGMENAFWDPQSREVILCHELLGGFAAIYLEFLLDEG